jgi:CDP-glycerol glycerophosphotransferase
MLFRLLNTFLYFLSGFGRRDPNKAVFGAWMGHRFADNPKYFLRYLSTRDHAYELIWCGREEARASFPQDLRARFVRYGSFAALRQLLTCGHCFVSHGFRDVGPFNLLRKASLTYLGHGLALKHMGSRDRPLRSRLLAALRRLWRHADGFSHMVAVSARHRAKILLEYATNNVLPEKILDCGQPRVDFLLQADAAQEAEIRRRLLSTSGSAEGQRIVAYLPTFRDRGGRGFSFAELSGLERRRIEELLGAFDAVLLEKAHFAAPAAPWSAGDGQAMRVHRLDSAEVDTQELLLAADLLITDYSGCYLDFLVLDRPVLHFAYDRATYVTSDRGLYFDLEEVAGGDVAETFDDLLASLEADLREPSRNRARRLRVRQCLLEYERGTASEEIAWRILGIAPPSPQGPTWLEASALHTARAAIDESAHFPARRARPE